MSEKLLINEDKSNNFDGKSNNELVPNRNELPSVLTNEENVSVKVKQIEEMANTLYNNRPYSDLWEEDAQDIAKVLYEAGYRKQSEVEKFAEEIKLEFYREFDEIIPSIMTDKIDELKKKYKICNGDCQECDQAIWETPTSFVGDNRIVGCKWKESEE